MPASPGSPQVSVIVPVRNGARFIGRAIESVLTQTLADLEVVIVDDGSTDQTLGILAEYTARDRRVRAFRQDAVGVSAARNRAVAESRAELIAQLDADDVALPDRIEKQVTWFDAHPEFAVLGGWMISIDVDDRKLRVHQYPTEVTWARLISGPVVANPTAMIRKSAFAAVGGYRLAFDTAGDFDLWLRMSERHAIANLAEVLTYYRLHEHQIGRRFMERQARTARLIRTLAQWRKEGRPDPIDQGMGVDAAMSLADPVSIAGIGSTSPA